MEQQDPNEQPDVVAPGEEGPITPPDEVPAPPDKPSPDVPPSTGDNPHAIPAD
jgi:hypothetical protein